MSDYQPHFVKRFQLTCLCGMELDFEPAVGQWFMLSDLPQWLDAFICKHETPAPLGEQK